jgi:hypothetical protein
MNYESFFRVLVVGLFACFCSLILIAGCNDGGNGNGGLGETSSCPDITAPCSSTYTSDDGTIITCVLDSSTCGVDLSDVIGQVAGSVTENMVMWIQVGGANGGDGIGPYTGSQGEGGYAQTTTTVSDLAASNNGSTEIFYFLGTVGGNSGDHCGGSGGIATIVTFEDLTLNPSEDPSSAQIILDAGGGGGSSNGDFGCVPFGTESACAGGVAIASTDLPGEGIGGDGSVVDGSL